MSQKPQTTYDVKMIHGQVESENCLSQVESHTRRHNQRFLQPYSRIDARLFSYVTLQQSDYRIAYPAVLLNPLTLYYLSNILILDNSYGFICTIYSTWRFLYSNKIPYNIILLDIVDMLLCSCYC